MSPIRFAATLALGFFLLAPAHGADAPKGDAEIAREKARAYAADKNWESARNEASKATQLNPEDPEAWLILGTVEQRLEHPEPALAAFRKFLALAPSSDKAPLVRERVAALEVASEKKTQQEIEEKSAKYGTQGNGLILGFAPVYKPSLTSSSSLNSNIGTSWIVGLRLGECLDLYVRYAPGYAGPFIANSTPTNTTNPTPTTFTHNHHVLYEGGGDVDIPLNQPFQSLGGFQFYLPLSLALFANFMNVADSGYSNFGMDVGAGAGARFYTGTFLVLDALFQYHLGLPLFDINDSFNNKLRNTAGEIVGGNVSGPELRLTATILF